MPDNSIYKIRQRLSSISIRKAAIYTLLSLLPFLFIFLMLGVTETLSGLHLELLSGITVYILPLILIWYAFHKKDLSLTPVLLKNKAHLKDLLMVVPLMMFAFGVTWVTILLLNFIDSDLAQGYLDFLNNISFLQTSADTPLTDYILIFIAVALLPPLLEEIVFRGAIIERLGRKYGFKTAVLLSSVIFGFLHADILGALFMGLILSVIYLKTYSLFIPIAIHAINNGLIVLFIYIDDQFLQVEPWDTIDSFISTGWMGVLLFVISSFWIAIYLKQNWEIIHQREPIENNLSNDSERLTE